MDLEDVLIVKTMGPEAFGNAVEVLAPAPVQELSALGSQLVVLAVALIAKMMDPQATERVVVVQAQAQAEARLEPRAIGTAVAVHVEENGKRLARIQAASFLGVLQSACLIMRPREQSTIPQAQQFSLQQLLEIQSGKMALAVESASCSLLRPVER